MEYEARLNYLLPRFDDTVVCLYDLARFNVDVVMDVLRTHPLVMLGGLLHENPFYVPPASLLRRSGESRAAGLLPVGLPAPATACRISISVQ